MTTKKKHAADEIAEAMVNNLGSDSLKELFHKTAGFGPCTFCGKMGHDEDACPKLKKIKEKEQKMESDKCECSQEKRVAAKAYALRNLAAVADTLDKQGFDKLANVIDESIKKIVAKDKEICD